MNIDNHDNTRRFLFERGHKSITHRGYFITKTGLRGYCYENNLMFDSIIECIIDNYTQYIHFDLIYFNDKGGEIAQAGIDMRTL